MPMIQNTQGQHTHNYTNPSLSMLAYRFNELKLKHFFVLLLETVKIQVSVFELR